MSNLARTIFDADVTAPSVPTISSVVALSTTALRVSWNAVTDNVNGTGLGGYGLYRASSLAGTYALIQTLSASSVSYDDTALSPGTQYFYKINAFDRANPVNVSAQSSAGNGTTNSAATGYDFYLAANGSDSNPGTQALPWAITALNTKQATYRGKRVGLLDGTYNVFSLLQGGINDGYQAVLEIDGGTAGSPTVIAAINPLGAIIEARNGGTTYSAVNSPIMGQTTAAHMGYVEIDGILFKGANSKCIYLGNYGVANGSSTRYDGYKVRNCEFTAQNATSQSGAGNNCSCVEMAGARGSEIKNNYFHDNIGPFGANSSNHFTSILTWYHETYLIEYNLCVNSSTIYGKEIGFFGGSVRYNYVDNSTDTSGGPETAGFADWCDDSNTSHGVATAVHHNVYIAPKGIDNRPGLGGASFVNDNYQYYNNTLVVVASGQSGGLMGKYGSGKVTAYNNLIISSASGDHCLMCLNVNADGLVDYNWYYHTGGDYRFNSYASEAATVRDVRANFAAWKSAMGGTVDSHSVTGSDPLITNTGAFAQKYQLQAGSGAKTAGRSDGTSGGSVVEIGAWGNGAPSRLGYDSTVRMT